MKLTSIVSVICLLSAQTQLCLANNIIEDILKKENETKSKVADKSEELLRIQTQKIEQEMSKIESYQDTFVRENHERLRQSNEYISQQSKTAVNSVELAAAEEFERIKNLVNSQNTDKYFDMLEKKLT